MTVKTMSKNNDDHDDDKLSHDEKIDENNSNAMNGLVRKRYFVIFFTFDF